MDEAHRSSSATDRVLEDAQCFSQERLRFVRFAERIEDGRECRTIGCNGWVFVAECQLAELNGAASEQFAFGMATAGMLESAQIVVQVGQL